MFETIFLTEHGVQSFREDSKPMIYRNSFVFLIYSTVALRSKTHASVFLVLMLVLEIKIQVLLLALQALY